MDEADDSAARMKRLLESTRFTHLVGIRVEEVRKGYVRASLPFRPELERSGGIVHGGAVFTLMDVTAGATAATAHGSFDPGTTNVTIAANTAFLGMVQGKDLVCEARAVKAGKSISFVECEVRADDEPVARGSLVFKATRSIGAGGGETAPSP